MLSSNVKYIGLDVHKEAIAIAVVNGAGKLVLAEQIRGFDAYGIESQSCGEVRGGIYDAPLSLVRIRQAGMQQAVGAVLPIRKKEARRGCHHWIVVRKNLSILRGEILLPNPQ